MVTHLDLMTFLFWTIYRTMRKIKRRIYVLTLTWHDVTDLRKNRIHLANQFQSNSNFSFAWSWIWFYYSQPILAVWKSTSKMWSQTMNQKELWGQITMTFVVAFVNWRNSACFSRLGTFILFSFDEEEWRMGRCLMCNDEYLRKIRLLTEIDLTFKITF